MRDHCRLCVVAIFVLPALAGTVCRANEFHVSPAGNDAATGDKAAPLKTLAAAIAAAKRAGAEAAHVILLAPGTYTPTSPILVDAGLTLTLRAEDPAQPPVLDGSALPAVADPKTNFTPALLSFTGGRILLEDLRIIRTPAHGIRAEGVSPFQMRRCSLEDINGHGVRVAGGKDAVVDSCEVKGVGGTGIWVLGGSRAMLTPNNAVISNNRVSDVNRWKDGSYLGNGIYVGGVGMTVRQNTIRDSVQVPWTQGIRVEGNNHLVEKNRLTHVAYGDAAGIYVAGRGLELRGNNVRFNFIEDCASGVYLDDRASGNLVTGNVILKASNTGVLIGGGQDNIVTFNVVADSAAFLRMDNRGMGWATLQHPFKNDLSKLQAFLTAPATQALYHKTYPALAALTSDNVLLPLNNVVNDNYADRASALLGYYDMDNLMKGKHQRSYEKWNKLKEPRSISVPKNRAFDLSRLGAPGVNTDQLGAQPSGATSSSPGARK